jgi:hypothetical protein
MHWEIVRDKDASHSVWVSADRLDSTVALAQPAEPVAPVASPVVAPVAPLSSFESVERSGSGADSVVHAAAKRSDESVMTTRAFEVRILTS